jgi:hypothetical protein
MVVLVEIFQPSLLTLRCLLDPPNSSCSHPWGTVKVVSGHCGAAAIVLSREEQEAVLVRAPTHFLPADQGDRASHQQLPISLLELPPVVVFAGLFLRVI